MGKKIAKGSGLTSRQEQFLDLALRNSYIIDNFYLTGGTALSSWYLHHRESEDLDFFSMVPFDYDKITIWLKRSQKDLGYKSLFIDEDYGFLTFRFRYSDETVLKVDFNHYTPVRLLPAIKWHNLEIDNLYDITVNKLQTISERPRGRDYIDIFFIFNGKHAPLDEFIADAQKKFNEPIDRLQLAKNFLKVVEYTDTPKILLPFDRKKMDEFFERLARDLEPKILT